MTADKRGPGRPQLPLPGPWAALARAFGGQDGLADVLLVSTRTLRRWAAGETSPSALERWAVEERLKARGQRSPWAGLGTRPA